MKKYLVIVAVFVLLGVVGFLIFRPQETKILPFDLKRQTGPTGSSSGTESDVSEETGNYVTYSQEVFDRVRYEGKVVMLYFWANWCPICREQEPVNRKAFADLETDKDIIILKVNILDSDTTAEDEALAEEFGVNYQHTFVILDPTGEVSYKYTGPLTEDELKQKLVEAKR